MEYGLVAVWWVAYVGLGLFGLPVAARLCASLPGRGAGFSLAISCGIVGLVGFWVGFLALGWVAVLAGLVTLAVCAVFAVRGGVEIDRRAAAEVLVVFTAVYLFVIAMRGVDPGITPDGEKFLDFGMMVSLYRAPHLPPEDFWFAGKSVIYYYGGHLLASLLTRLTGTHPWYGFNLSMAGFFGMLAAGVYELAGAVAVGRESGFATGSPRRKHTRVPAGVTAVFFAMFAANLSTAARLVVRRLPSPIRGPAVAALVSADSQFTPDVILSPIPKQYHYKIAGRVIADTQDPFVLFAIVRGDLRPYVLSTPFMIAVVGLCYAYYRTPETAVRRRRVVVFGAIPALAGFIAVVNTWSLGVVVGVVWLTLTFAPARLGSLFPHRLAAAVDSFVDRPIESPRGALARVVGAVAVVVCVVLVSVVVALPFFLGPVQSRPDSPLVILAANARSSLGALVLVHGAFLAVFVAYYLARGRARWNTAVAAAGLLVFGAFVLLVPRTLVPLVLFGVPLVVGGTLLVTDRDVGFEGVLIVAGLGLVSIAELAYLEPGIGGRFNTVVKTYMPAWILWSSAVGVVLPRLVCGRHRWSWSRRQVLASGLAAVVLISTAAFGGVALRGHFANPAVEEPTLDGMAAAENNVPGEVAAIRWLYNRSGTPTVVSAASPYIYRWSAAPAASLTGVPTVIGVPHEIQFRGRTAYINRARAVNTIYLGSDQQRVVLLERYDVEYVYVGPTERDRYGDFSSFADLRGVRVAFQADSVTVYAVDHDRLGT